jgi:hypothetical protein
MTKDATGIITRDFVLNVLIRQKMVLTKDIHDLPHEVNQYVKTQITKYNNKHIKK